MSYIHKHYRIPFWKGCLHAFILLLYVLFMSLSWVSISQILTTEFTPLVHLALGLFVLILSLGFCVYFLFFEPLKLIVHHHFKAATMMMFSTFGWLLIFFTLFIIGFVNVFYF
jgi:hypothetical protein